MKKLEHILAKMRPKLQGYAMGGSVANEPMQYNSQQKALMGNRGQQKKGYNDIISDYHTPAGSAYRFTNPSAPIPFDAEKRFKQNVAQEGRVMNENFVMQQKAADTNLQDTVSIAEERARELQREAYQAAREGRELQPLEQGTFNKTFIPPKQKQSNPYLLQAEQQIEQGHSSIPPQYQRRIELAKQEAVRPLQRDLEDMRRQQLGTHASIADLMNVPEQERELPLTEQIERHTRRMNQTLGDNEAKMQQTLEQMRAEQQAQLGGYAGWKSPQQVEQELAAKQVDLTKYKPIGEYNAMQQQLAQKANLAYTPQQYQQGIANTQAQYAGYVHPSTYAGYVHPTTYEQMVKLNEMHRLRNLENVGVLNAHGILWHGKKREW